MMDPRIADPAEALAFTLRWVRGEASATDIQRMVMAMQERRRRGGEVSLDDVLGLPAASASGRVKPERDEWLRCALSLLSDSGGQAAVRELAITWRRFCTTVYPRWRDDGDPPEEAAELNKALFYATRANGGGSLGERQLYRLLGTASPDGRGE